MGLKLRLMKAADRLLAVILRVLPAPSPIPLKLNRILVIKLSAMGDAFCLMPTLRSIQAEHPHASIDWLTTARTQPALFATLPFVAKVSVMPTNPLRLAVFLLRHFRQARAYDLIIDADQYYKVSELLARAGRSSAGFDTPIKGRGFSLSLPYDVAANEKTEFLRLARMAARLSPEVCQAHHPELPELLQGFKPSESLLELQARARSSGRPVVVIYPGSSPNASMRRWPLERFIGLTQRCTVFSTVLLAGGPDEASLIPALEQAGLGAHIEIQRWSLREWLWIFRHVADVFVGNDAGLLHLAESQGLPSVGLFGPNIGSKWGSLLPRSRIVDLPLPCRPCIRTSQGVIPQHCHRGDLACMNGIEIDMVLHAVRSVLDPHRTPLSLLA